MGVASCHDIGLRVASVDDAAPISQPAVISGGRDCAHAGASSASDAGRRRDCQAAAQPAQRDAAADTTIIILIMAPARVKKNARRISPRDTTFRANTVPLDDATLRWPLPIADERSRFLYATSPA